MNRLNSSTLGRLPAEVRLPQYNRQQLKPGLVHLGIGAFHRAHQAFYTEAVLNQFGGDWGIIGCSLRSTAVSEQLTPQDGLYTLVERSGTGERLQIIGAVQQVLVGPEDPAGLVAIMADPNIKIVSLTITEKGYCHDPATGNLNLQHPDIIYDLKHPAHPRSAIGYLVAALQQRFITQKSFAASRSFTVLSCDNLPSNGKLLQKLVLQFASHIAPDLSSWIKQNTAFPCTMIDRIVPATTDADRQVIATRLGLRDEAMVVAEPFAQWVIEDWFSDVRPPWEKVGAHLVDDVRIFEKMKLRLLNGSHSILAYTGYLAGFDYISEVMSEASFTNMITQYMTREAGATIAAPASFDLEQYKRQLCARFSNKALKHRTWQIAMDGSQKLPQRLLETVREQLAVHGSIDIICLAVAAWIRYISGVDEKGNLIEVVDPMIAILRERCEDNLGNSRAMVKAIVAFTPIFGADLERESRFVDATAQWLERFYSRGVLATIRQHFA